LFAGSRAPRRTSRAPRRGELWRQVRMTIAPGKDSWRSAVVIVAHPDDETIWCGGLILQNPEWDWTIMSLCRGDDADRAPKFHRACERYGAQAIITELDDGQPLAEIDPRKEIAWPIRYHLGGQEWDLVVTHGQAGEYGHQRHREVHAEVMRLSQRGLLNCREVWTFSCHCDAARAFCRARKDSDIMLPLTDAQLAEKKRIVREMYGYGSDSFELRVCTSPEGFHRHTMERLGEEK
jgi:LmbE family N-acetylglucosaminyl deacetylase